jgi:hypothetical protein
METLTIDALEFYPPAPSNGGELSELTPPKVGEWVWQPKVDDWRGVVDAPSGVVWSQYGDLSTIALQGKIKAALAILRAKWGGSTEPWQRFDVGLMENRHDLMRGSIIIFDVMDSCWPHHERRAWLESKFPVLPLAHIMLAGVANVRDEVFLINEWREDTISEKMFPVPLEPLALQRLLKRENDLVGHKFYEGLVAKRADALYPVATKAKQKTAVWVKHRFDQ